MAKQEKQKKSSFISRRSRMIILALVWSIFVGPFVGMYLLLFISSFDDLPTFDELENPKSLEATLVYSSDGEVIGKYFRENRVNVEFGNLSPYLIDCLIATEDERYYEHAGIDLKALPRVFSGLATGDMSKGGGSTITQQLAKMLFTTPAKGKWERGKQKLKEWIIAARLERSYTKEEIITMYLNKFDFVNNAVGIYSAAKVYFNTTPDSLTLDQAALLVGMCQNPSKYNPNRFPEAALKRREIVLHQLKRNADNPSVSTKISQQQYDSLRQLPIGLKFQRVDHAEGPAPYFRERLRLEVQDLLESKDEDGEYKYVNKKTGKPYDIYKDGLRIYSTIDSRMQAYAEFAVTEHLSKDLQPSFDKDNKRWKNAPFSNDLKPEKIDEILNTAKVRSSRYLVLTGKRCGNCERPKDYIRKEGNKFVCSHCGHETAVKSDKEIEKIFNTPVKMTVFSWNKKGFEFDTTMTPMDSIRYYKKFLQVGFMAMDPNTGFIKAWVGGPNFKHFQYDHVKQGARQVGSIFKPFVYAAAFRDRLFSPCSEIPDIEHCIEVPLTANTTKPWCPRNGEKYTGVRTPLYCALPGSMNNLTAAIIKEEKPATVIKMAEALGIPEGYLDPVPAICLGVCDLSVFQITGAQSAFANKGIYIKPMMFTRIEDRHGNVIVDVMPETNEAMDELTAYMMLEIMKGVTSGAVNPNNGKVYGTGLRIRSSAKPYGGLKTPIAGKTGTTQGNSDGWFIGITPDLVTGVWVGAEDRGVRFSRTDLGQGANTSLPIFGYFMKKVYADKTLKISQGDFERPEGLNHSLLDCRDFKATNQEIWRNVNFNEVEQENFDLEGDDDEL